MIIPGDNPRVIIPGDNPGDSPRVPGRGGGLDFLGCTSILVFF